MTETRLVIPLQFLQPELVFPLAGSGASQVLWTRETSEAPHVVDEDGPNLSPTRDALGKPSHREGFYGLLTALPNGAQL